VEYWFRRRLAVGTPMAPKYCTPPNQVKSRATSTPNRTVAATKSLAGIPSSWVRSFERFM